MSGVISDQQLMKAFAARESAQAGYLRASSFPAKAGAASILLTQALRLNLMARFARVAQGEDQAWLRRNRFLTHAGTASPGEMVTHYRLAIACLSKWEEARNKKDFRIVAPALKELIAHVREHARQRGQKLGLSPYDTLLDEHTPGLRYGHICEWENDLLSFSQSAHAAHQKKKPAPEKISASWAMNRAAQEGLERRILAAMGVNLKQARLAETQHPLCLGQNEKVTIGMRFDEGDVLPLILNTAHEGGHALYRQNLPDVKAAGLAARVAGAGMDEAMALLMENHVARNPAFLKIVLPDMPQDTETRLYGADCTGLRMNADEIRYPLDVISRTHIERALIDGWYSVDALPDLWQWTHYLMSKSEAQGARDDVLQDIHMFSGVFGWMPAYFVGQLAAAQIYETAIVSDPRIAPGVTQGNAEPLANWLCSKVYAPGASADTLDMVKAITGKDLNVSAYKAHVQKRYL